MIVPQDIRGSAFETGRKRALGVGHLPMPDVGDEDIAFARQCRDVTASVCPALIDLYDGFADGGGWDRDRFLVYFFARKEGLLRGCTNFAATPDVSEGAECLVGRNYDWAYSDLAFCGARSINVEGHRSFVSYTHHWIGHPDCLNESGLFVAISSLARKKAEHPGVQWNLLVDAVAMTCDTVEEAVDVLTGARHLRSITYLIADARSAAAVEATPDGTVVREPSKGIVVATNHEVGHTDPSDRTRHSVARYDRALERLQNNEDKVSEELVREVLADPVCTIREGKRYLHPLDHVPLAAKENWGTIWSTICRPGNRQLKIAQGHPKDCPYESVAWN